MARTKTPLNPELKILKALSTRKELEQYKMKSIVELSYRHIIRTLKPLEEKGFIRIVRTEPSEKGGKEKKIYAITYRGFWYALINAVPKNSDDYEQMFLAHSELTLTYKKWSLLKDNGLSKDIIYHLMLYLIRWVENDRYKPSWRNQAEWSESLDTAMLMPLAKSGGGIADSLLNACKLDGELKAFLDFHIGQEISRLQSDLREMEIVKAKWQRLT